MKSSRHITLKCGRKIYLSDLEEQELSYVPCGQDRDGKDTPLLSFKHLWKSRRQVKLASYGKLNPWKLVNMTGVQLMTGRPSNRGKELLTDIDIEHRFIEKYPELHQRIRDMYIEACEGDPCIITTKSGGVRLMGFCEYLDRKRSYTDKDLTPAEIAERKQQQKPKPMLVEFFSEYGLSRLDHRYAIEQGSVLELPSYPKTLLQEIHTLILNVSEELAYKPTSERKVVGTSQIGDLEILWEADNRSQLFSTTHCQITSHTSNRNEVRFTRYPDGSIDGHCFNCGETWWEVPPPQRKRSPPIRLKVSDCQRETQSLEDQREMLETKIQAVVEEKRKLPGQHIINVTSAAGTGKTTLIITTYNNLFFITKTKEEADQAFSIAYDEGKDPWRHRPRMHNRDEDNWEQIPFGLGPNERPCMYPEVCNNLILRGHDVVPSFCAPLCEHYLECKDLAFLKQRAIEPGKQQVFMSWTEIIFSDVRFESRVKEILNGEKLLVLDEANPTHLPQKREIVTKDLLDVLESWRFPSPEAYDAFVFLDRLVKEMSTAKKSEQIREAFRKSLRLLTDDEIKQIDDALSKIPVGLVWGRDTEGLLYATAIHGDNIEKRLYLSDGDVLPPEGFDGTIPKDFARDGVVIDTLEIIKVDLALFQRFGFCDMHTQSHAVPRRLFNFVADLKTFVNSESNACFKDERSDIEYYLPPGLNAPLGLTLTASDTDDLISEVYRPTDICATTITTPPPPFKPGSKIFQIATGRYTAKSALLEKVDEEIVYKADGTENPKTIWKSKPILKRMLRTILAAAAQKHDDNKIRFRDTFVVGAKDMVMADDPIIEDMRENPFIYLTEGVS